MITLRLSDVSVAFPIFDSSDQQLKLRLIAAATGGLIGRNAAHHVYVQALNNVSLTLDHGDRVGLVGHNGSGKSTLLRVMAGIYEPTSGTLHKRGRVAAILGLGHGMDPDSTGRENILLSGLYCGLSKAQIRTQIEEVVDFTELGSFIDLPLRTYSAGMVARLAFAVATLMEPEILLLDESIGAGDASFMEKANRRVEALVGRAGILVLASHSEDLLRRWCSKGVLLEKGQIVASASIDKVLDQYNHPSREESVSRASQLHPAIS
jgi:ABC-type polysaccharide/polyol phosphate transport system ATPase subunit